VSGILITRSSEQNVSSIRKNHSIFLQGVDHDFGWGRITGSIERGLEAEAVSIDGRGSRLVGRASSMGSRMDISLVPHSSVREDEPNRVVNGAGSKFIGGEQQLGDRKTSSVGTSALVSSLVGRIDATHVPFDDAKRMQIS